MEKDYRQIACPLTSSTERTKDIVEAWRVLNSEHVSPTAQPCEKRLSK